MKAVLITGMSGTGKSTLIGELVARGYRAIDMDDPGWSETASDGEWVWREDRVEELLSGQDAGVLFVAGCTSNQVKFYPRFDSIVLLSAPIVTIKERLAKRTNNPFGKRPEELKKILRDTEETEPLLRRSATHEIVTDVPLNEIVEELLRITRQAP